MIYRDIRLGKTCNIFGQESWWNAFNECIYITFLQSYNSMHQCHNFQIKMIDWCTFCQNSSLYQYMTRHNMSKLEIYFGRKIGILHHWMNAYIIVLLSYDSINQFSQPKNNSNIKHNFFNLIIFYIKTNKNLVWTDSSLQMIDFNIVKNSHFPNWLKAIFSPASEIISATLQK